MVAFYRRHSSVTQANILHEVLRTGGGQGGFNLNLFYKFSILTLFLKSSVELFSWHSFSALPTLLTILSKCVTFPSEMFDNAIQNVRKCYSKCPTMLSKMSDNAIQNVRQCYSICPIMLSKMSDNAIQNVRQCSKMSDNAIQNVRLCYPKCLTMLSKMSDNAIQNVRHFRPKCLNIHWN